VTRPCFRRAFFSSPQGQPAAPHNLNQKPSVVFAGQTIAFCCQRMNRLSPAQTNPVGGILPEDLASLGWRGPFTSPKGHRD
jgi:hypothetical protein